MSRLESTRTQSRGRTSAVAVAAALAIERLESRTLLNATLTSAINPVGVAPGQTPPVINLSQHFDDPNVPGTLVDVTTPLGVIPIALTDSKTPNTVANFLSYINSGAYNGTIFHRLATGFALQGGGYTTSGNPIATNPPINGEPGQSNVTGSIAMALTSAGPNSGTSQWFVNLANNDGSGSTPNLNDTSDGGPFTVFGHVVYGGMSVVNQITALTTVNDSQNPPGMSGSTNIWNQLPVLSSYTGSSTPTSVPPADMVTTGYQVVAPLTYSATSDNPSLINPTISGSNLTLNFGSGSGTTQVHVTATDIAGNTATTTFTVGVGIQTVTVGANGVGLVKFRDFSGSLGQLAITGKGTATVSLIGAGLTVGKNKGGVVTVDGKASSVSVSTASTSPNTVLTIVGSGAGVHLENLTTDGPLAELNARFASVSGMLTASGAIKNLMLGNVSGGTITIGGGPAVNISLGNVNNTVLGSYVNIVHLTAKSWTGTSQINAPAIRNASIAGSFAANVFSPEVGNFTVGTITGGNWNVAGTGQTVKAQSINGWTATFGKATTLRVGGAVTSSTISSTQNINTFVSNGFTGSHLYAGLANFTTGLPSAIGNFTSNSKINSFIDNGRFVNSDVAAQQLGKISMGSVTTSNNGVTFGAAAHSIVELNLTADGKKLHLKKVTTQSQVTTAFSKQGITPQDLAIRIL
ncbi:MAG TPA: peptidylprolyl isomerase [Tepidisphaeraceae bacterium]|nr:peptidylprolyl isomerase [Tepidisphaeraceae bacterium]